MSDRNGTQPPLTEIDNLPSIYQFGPPEPLGRGLYRLSITDHMEPEQVILHELRLGNMLDRWALADRLVTHPDDKEQLRIELDALARTTIASTRRPAPPLVDWDVMIDQPPVEWLIDGILPKGVMASLTGKWGAGKSFLAAAWALCVGTGRDWLGRPTTAGGAIHIAAEGYRSERLQAYAARWPVTVYPRVWWRRGKLGLAHRHEIDEFLGQVKALPYAPTLIIIDTLARCAVGLKENDASDMAMVVDGAAQMIEATGATVLFLHHPPHDTQTGGSQLRGRGSSAIDAACDTTMVLTKNSGGLELSVTKQKDGDLGEPIPLAFVRSGPAIVIDLNSPENGQVNITDDDRAVLRILTATLTSPSGGDLRDLVKTEGHISTDRAREAISRCKHYGYIASPEGKRQAWSITERGRMALLT